MAVDFKDYARRMDGALSHLEEEFGAVRAGRANAKVWTALLLNTMAARPL